MIDTKEKSVRLGDFLRKEDVHLDVAGTTQLDVMRELVSSLGLDAEGCSGLLKDFNGVSPWNRPPWVMV